MDKKVRDLVMIQVILLLLLALVIITTGCGSSGSGGSTPPAPDTPTIDVCELEYEDNQAYAVCPDETLYIPSGVAKQVCQKSWFEDHQFNWVIDYCEELGYE